MKTILKSHLVDLPDFDKNVKSHAKEMANWKMHMALVAKDAKDKKMKAIDRHVAYPAPQAHPLVRMALNENHEPDYKIENDDPTSDQVLLGKKSELSEKLLAAFHAANERVCPARKVRLFLLKRADIEQVDYERRKLMGGNVSMDEVIKGRAKEDVTFMAEQAAIEVRMRANHRIMAQGLSDIEDLTIKKIDGWELPNFPTQE